MEPDVAAKICEGTMAEKDWSILLIEDDPQVSKFIQSAFASVQEPRFRIKAVENLKDAVTRLEAGKPDLILSDLGLPDSEGLETVQKVLKEAPGVPVIVLTGQQDEALALQAVQAGAEDYLQKGRVDFRGIFKAALFGIERTRKTGGTSEEIAEHLRVIQTALSLQKSNHISAEDALETTRKVMEQLESLLK